MDRRWFRVLESARAHTNLCLANRHRLWVIRIALRIYQTKALVPESLHQPKAGLDLVEN